MMMMRTCAHRCRSHRPCTRSSRGRRGIRNVSSRGCCVTLCLLLRSRWFTITGLTADEGPPEPTESKGMVDCNRDSEHEDGRDATRGIEEVDAEVDGHSILDSLPVK